MWVVYRKSDGAVIARTRSEKVDAHAMLEEVARGQVGSPSLTDFAIVHTKDGEAVTQMGRPGRRQELAVRIKTDGTAQIVDETPDESFLQVTTNATQLHPVDNVPLIPADGSSFLVVTLQKLDEEGQAVSRKTVDNETIWLRTDHGTLRENTEDAKDIRSIKLVSGTASFRIYSGTERRLATVQMLSTNPDLQAAGVQVEFT